jgi:SH3-like domain-containing protein
MRSPLPVALLLTSLSVPLAVAQTFPPPPPSVLSTQSGRPAPPVVAPAAHPHAEKPKSKPAATKPSKPPPAKPQTAKPPAPKTIAKPKSKPAAPPAAAPAIAPAAPPVAPPPALDPTKGTVTGQELPRWASLRSDEVNLRIGPGTNFQIDWVYHRRDLPVRIEREYEVWRQVEDADGVKGWVHQANLAARRGFVTKDSERVLRASADDAAAPVARLRPGVVGRIRSCAANVDWCEVQAGDYRGFLKREEFWGSSPGEAVN